MRETGQIRRCQRLKKVRRHVATLYNPHDIFSIGTVLKTESFIRLLAGVARQGPSNKNGV